MVPFVLRLSKPIDRTILWKGLVTFSCTFAVIQILDNIGSLPVVSWAISMKLSDYYFFMPI
jgi:hypothetical protein